MIINNLELLLLEIRVETMEYSSRKKGGLKNEKENLKKQINRNSELYAYFPTKDNKNEVKRLHNELNKLGKIKLRFLCEQGQNELNIVKTQQPTS